MSTEGAAPAAVPRSILVEGGGNWRHLRCGSCGHKERDHRVSGRCNVRVGETRCCCALTPAEIRDAAPYVKKRPGEVRR